MTAGTSRVELRDDTVRKYFTDPEDYARELAVYERRLPQTPALLDFSAPQWIEMARIEGTPYLDIGLTQKESSRLAKTIAAFHHATLDNGLCLCHWDNQPRNVLAAEDSFYLIDFAESRFASPEADLSHLLLFWAGEFPPPALKKLATAFILAYQEALPLAPTRWQLSLAQSIERFDQRRARHCHLIPHLDPSQLATNRDTLFSLVR
ncbi:MAG: phosphotransferase [Candidatus Syntrophosphaera sp.]|nr:phosphotransferase [Candidatus Syntrophosphaera sp.]